MIILQSDQEVLESLAERGRLTISPVPSRSGAIRQISKHGAMEEEDNLTHVEQQETEQLSVV